MFRHEIVLMSEITDEYMHEMLETLKPYTLILLHSTPKRNELGADKIIWEHGRRNFALRRDGLLCLVCPATDEGSVAGMYIFRTNVEETKKIMDGDPAVMAGVFTYDAHALAGFPGDALAK